MSGLNYVVNALITCPNGEQHDAGPAVFSSQEEAERVMVAFRNAAAEDDHTVTFLDYGWLNEEETEMVESAALFALLTGIPQDTGLPYVLK